MVIYTHRPELAGLGGGNETAVQITSSAGAIAAGAVTATTAATTAAIAVPIIGAAVLAATLVLSAIARRNRQKSAATQIVNEIEPALKANLTAYMQGPRTVASREQALNNFDAAWQMVLQHCGASELGSAGKRCIDERKAGGIAPWCTNAGQQGCDWFSLYRDPIAADTPNADPIANAAGEILGLTPEQAAQAPQYLAIAALLAGALML